MASDDTPRRGPIRSGAWPKAPMSYGATVVAGSALPSYSGLYGGAESLAGQNGYAGTQSLSGAQFGGGGDAGSAVGGTGGGSGDTAS